MKLKEFPFSLARALRLRSLPLSRLYDAGRPRLPVTVSLTSIPSRLHVLPLAIRSILAQTQPPARVVLWLNRDLEDHVPRRLHGMRSDIFQIRFSDRDSSHLKLVESIRTFPDQILVTCDDDVMVDPRWLETLYRSHARHPDAVIAHVCRRISHGADGTPLPYARWPMVTEPGTADDALLALGWGGVLYPAGALHPSVTDADLYLRLAPRADDLWFKAMAVLNGTRIRVADQGVPTPYPIAGSQKVSLKRRNVGEDENRRQWLALAEHFHLGAE